MRWMRGKGRILVNTTLAVMLVVLYITVSTPVAKTAMSELYNSPVYRGHEKGVIGMECAVSWNAAAMPDLLDVLHEGDTRITFFISGEWAKENSELLQRMVREGHEIGTMGNDPGQDGSKKRIADDVAQSLTTIMGVCGVQPRLYYSGTRNVGNSSKAAQSLELTHVMCTVDLLSGRGNAEDILLRALDNPFDGSILLIQPTAEAVKALPAILLSLEEKGFRTGTVSEALGETTEEEIKA